MPHPDAAPLAARGCPAVGPLLACCWRAVGPAAPRVRAGQGGTRRFSRSLEDLTPQFPDVAGALEQVLPTGVIVEGEALAIDEAGNLLPFQVIAKRRGRKHGLAEKLEEIPVGVRLFDLLYANGQETLATPFTARRERLET